MSNQTTTTQSVTGPTGEFYFDRLANSWTSSITSGPLQTPSIGSGSSSFHQSSGFAITLGKTGYCPVMDKNTIEKLSLLMEHDCLYLAKSSSSQHNSISGMDHVIICIYINHNDRDWRSGIELYKYDSNNEIEYTVDCEPEKFAENLLNMIAAMLMMSGKVVYVNDKEYNPVG